MSEVQTLTAGMIELNRLEQEMFNSNKWALFSSKFYAEYYSKEYKLEEAKYLDILRTHEILKDSYHSYINNESYDYTENESTYLRMLLDWKEEDYKYYTFISYCINVYTEDEYSKLREACLTHLIINQFDVNWDLVQKEDIIKKLDLSLDKKESPFFDELFDRYNIDKNNVYEPFSHNFKFSYQSGSERSIDDIVFNLWENVMKGLKDYKKKYIFKPKGEELNITDRKFSAIYIDKYNLLDNDDKKYDLLIESALNLLDEKGYLFIRLFDFYRKEYIELFKFLAENKLLKEVYGNHPATLVVTPRKSDSFVIKTDTLLSRGYRFDNSCFKIQLELDTKYFKTYDYSLIKLFNAIGTGERNLYWRDFMEEYPGVKYNDVKGHVFTKNDQSKDYDSAICSADELSIMPVDNEFTKITENVIVVDYSNHFNVTYLKATTDIPAFIPKSSLLGIWKMNEDVVYPLYFYYLSESGKLDEITRSHIHFFDGPYLEEGEKPYYYLNYEPIGDFQSDMFFPISSSVERQKESYDSIYSVWKQIKDNREQKARFEQKEWLNEKHIRNIKHRLNDELTPLYIGLNSLKNFMEESGGRINSNDVIGVKSGRTVAMQLESLMNQISKIESSIKELTDSNMNSHFEILDVNNVVREYISKALWKFPIEHVTLSPEARILGNSKLLSELIDLIIENANRHGFIGRESSQNKVIIRVENTIGGKCRISISNNGKPMSERASKIYFERGSYAGETGNSGIGGARIKDIVERMQGTVSLQLDETNEFPVSVEMLFLNIY